MPTRREQLAHLLNELEISARAAAAAHAHNDTDAAYRHQEDALSYRSAVILQLDILERKLQARP